MKKMVYRCPCCSEPLYASVLHCNNCDIDIKSEFELNKFDSLTEEQYNFLLVFLKNRGNLKILQDELSISYPTAKKKLDELLYSLELMEVDEDEKMEDICVGNLIVDRTSVKASEIVKAKLLDCGGRVIVHTVRGLPCEVTACPDGKSFESNKLPIKPAYQYTVFDAVVDVLIANGGRARKGNGRSYKLGHPECDENTVVGAIAQNYSGKNIGDSVFDPVFVLAAVLEWVGIVSTERGELVLTQSYKEKL